MPNKAVDQRVKQENLKDYRILVHAIVGRQKHLIGPLAIEKANRVEGLWVSDDLELIDIQKDPLLVLDDLVKEYSKLSGRAAVYFCRKAVAPIIKEKVLLPIPEVLK